MVNMLIYRELVSQCAVIVLEELLTVYVLSCLDRFASVLIVC
jgi:hypothetical protein